MNIDKLIQEKSGIYLDIACGNNKQSDLWVGLDCQALPGVDIVWDINNHPWPLPDECVKLAIASHIIEHIPAVAIESGKTWFPFVEFMNEVWRVMKFDGEIAISTPYGGSPGYLQDPTHCHQFNEASFIYFDPLHISGYYKYYRPKPWKIKNIFWNLTGTIEAVLVKRRDDPSYHD